MAIPKSIKSPQGQSFSPHIDTHWYDTGIRYPPLSLSLSLSVPSPMEHLGPQRGVFIIYSWIAYIISHQRAEWHDKSITQEPSRYELRYY